MSDNNSPDPKKAFSNNFIWLLLGVIALIMLLQTYLDTKEANVGFSYQLEHLVNLNLIEPEQSSKTALNDNLVTFSGTFRNSLTEEGKTRFKYLELLNAHEELAAEKHDLEQELSVLKDKVVDAGTYFLQISNTSVPEQGYVVVDDRFSTHQNDASVTLYAPKSTQNITSIQTVRTSIQNALKNPTTQSVSDVEMQLQELIGQFRSPLLGVGNESLKAHLRTLSLKAQDLQKNVGTPTQILEQYDALVTKLEVVTKNLQEFKDHVRLGKLRAVRNYKETLEEYTAINNRLEENQLQLDKARQDVANTIWFFNNKELSTRTLEKQDPELFHQWYLSAKEEWNRFSLNKGAPFKAPDQPLNTVLEKTFRSQELPPNYASYFFTILPVLLVILFLYFIFSRQMKGMGGGAMNFGKSPAKLMTKEKNRVTFKDVAGIDEAIEELQEIVDFLKNPQKFTALGGHIPKGVLCIGSPGTGKTLIAKAVAGEADRPFFSISGSDFVEMFVGVGASRIRDMFDQAKRNAPCIIFMDEIDAVGRHRGAGIGGGHDEREQTLNQLLVEMDGFDTNDGVILIAATNRPDVLDKALLRPGRFDRRIVINLPDIKGRYEILGVHAKKIKLDQSVNLMEVAKSTPGCSGADLQNLLNEAALMAARRSRTAVTMQEIQEARDKVLYGKERKSLEMDLSEKETTAYHEAGHTIVALKVEHADPVDKVTIIPRGMSLGATMFLPEKNRVSYWKQELYDQLAVLMGGRVAEEIFVKDVSSGAQQDFRQATDLARSMVCEWGMSETLGTVAYKQRSESGQYLGMTSYAEKSYSEKTAQEIDTQVRKLLDHAYQRATQIILGAKEEVELMTKMLIEFETLDRQDIENIVHGKWDIEEKQKRLKLQAELHKIPSENLVPPPPPSPTPNDPTLQAHA